MAKAYKVGNASLLTQGLRIVVPWMVERRQVWPKEMDKKFVAAFIDDLPTIIAVEVDDEEVITEGSAYMPLKIIDLIWCQRQALEDAGIAPMPERPWNDEKGANTIVKRIVTQARGWIRPIPDEVTIPLLNKAAWFLGKPAADVLELRARIENAYNRVGSDPAALGLSTQAKILEFIRNDLYDFEFSLVDGECQQWTESLLNVEGMGKAPSISMGRRLVAAVVGATCITIQSSTGMRASEICALRAGINPETTLPYDVRIVSSSSDLNEVFVLRSMLTKGEEVPLKDDWLLGMRPKGSDEIPLPVRAMLILEKLLAFERSIAGTNRLLVSFKKGISFPRKSADVSIFDSLRLNALVKSFVEQWVDLSGLPDQSAHRISPNDLIHWRESKGRDIRPHQFRKTYAQFALSIDPNLLPAVQRQFHHVALAMTEGGYWGRNRIQIEPVNAMASQLTAMQLYEMATGRTKATGKMGVQLEQRIEAVRKLVEGAGLEVGWRRVSNFVRDNNLHMWFSPPGNCFPLNPKNMSCHKAAGTRPIGLPIPNFTTREPSLCAGCDCFILDLRHVGFWQERYVTNLRTYKQAEARGQEGMFRVAAARAVVAQKLLNRLG
ncbi:MAG: hypothetical protein ABI076_00305, partial [Acidobacteriaceae bacterium]